MSSASGSRVRRICLYAICAALAVAAQLALAFLPNIELVSLLFIIYTQRLRLGTLYIIYTFAFAECLIFGFHTWSLTYMYVWTVLFGLFMLIKTDSPLTVAAISGVFGLIFGTLCAMPYFFIMGWNGGIATIIAGLGFDIAHGIGNFTAALLLYKPLSRGFDAASRLLLSSGVDGSR